MFYSVNVGVDFLDRRLPAQALELRGCVYSAQKMRNLVARFAPAAAGAHVGVVLADPTVQVARNALAIVARSARPGDTVLFSFHGHGMIFEARDPESRALSLNAVRLDQHLAEFDSTTFFNPTVQPSTYYTTGILFHDRLMLVSEYFDALGHFQRGVRFISIIDCCSAAAFELPESNVALAAEALQRAELVWDGEEDPTGEVLELDCELYGVLVPSVAAQALLPIPLIHFASCDRYNPMWVSDSGTLFVKTLSHVLHECGSKVPLPTYSEICALVRTRMKTDSQYAMVPSVGSDGLYDKKLLDRPFLT